MKMYEDGYLRELLFKHGFVAWIQQEVAYNDILGWMPQKWVALAGCVQVDRVSQDGGPNLRAK
jgi:hypothetical protein